MILQTYGLIWVSVLIFGMSGISVMMELGLARSLLFSATRSFLQLALIGLILSFVFKKQEFWLNLLVIATMTGIAAHAISQRITRPQYRGMGAHTVIALAGGAWIFSVYGAEMVLSPGSWKKAEVILPFAGILLGNSLSGISQGLAHWNRSFQENLDLIETRLAHGATGWESIRLPFREAMHAGMNNIMNSMSVAGVVSLPGMMTGQLLAGADPHAAVGYQIAAMFLIAAATFFGMLIALFLGFRSVINPRHQLTAIGLTQ